MNEELEELRNTLNDVIKECVALENEVERLKATVANLTQALLNNSPEETGLWCETITWTDN